MIIRIVLIGFYILFARLDLLGQSLERPACGVDSSEPMAESQLFNSPSREATTSILQQRNPVVIPVVIHVVWNSYDENISDELIVSQIKALNRDFNRQNSEMEEVPQEFRDRVANIGISFCLASETPKGLSSNGIVRVMTSNREIGISDSLFADSCGGSSAWNTEQYLNIWVANTGKYIAGYAGYPESTPAYKTGVVIDSKYFGINGHARYGLGRTLVHEIGHYFGLKHIWSSDPFCEQDDGIYDTPKQTFPHTGCPGYPQASCTDSDMFMNFMDYVDDPCMWMFTTGQREKVWDNIATYLPGFLNNSTGYNCIKEFHDNNLDFHITPNPASETFTITFIKDTDSIVRVQIFDIIGRLCIDNRMYVSNSFTVNVNNLIPGIYLVKVGKVLHTFIKGGY